MLRNAAHILASAAALALAGVSAADSVRLRAAVRVAPDAEITLGDVAELDGAKAQALSKTRVGRGETGAFTLSVERVRQQLVVAGADMRAIEIEGTATIVRPLRGAAASAPAASGQPTAAAATKGVRVIDPSAESAAPGALGIICELMRNAFGDDASALRLEMSEEQLAKIAPATGFRYEVVRKTALRASRADFEVIARNADGDELRTRVRVTPKLEREVLVARSESHRGDAADDAAVAHERRLLDLDQAKDALAPAELRNGTFARSVAAGKTIERGDLARTNDVKRRDTLTIRREIGMVAIEFEAVALEDGAKGDVISVERTDRRKSRENKPLSAEVTGPGRAVIR